MKSNNNSNLSLWLSVISLVGVAAFAILWICNVRPQSVVSLDSFIGVATGLIGIMVTFAIGWQIVNAMELKSKIAELEQLKSQIDNLQEDLIGVAYSSKAETSRTIGTISMQNQNPILAFHSFHNALLSDVSVPLKYAKFATWDLNSLSRIIQILPLYQPKGQDTLESNKKSISYIKEAEEQIRQAPLFNMIEAQYNAIMSEFYKRVSYEE